MNLRTVDLNLLVALNALLTELHVTRAADRIGLSQPAMSNALSRLRHIFKDELLVRTSSGMQATPRALELTEPTRQILKQIERVFDSDTGFDPAATQRSFTLRLSDLLSVLLLPALTAALQNEAPKVSLDVIHISPVRTVEALEKDEIDLAVSMGLVHSNAIRSDVLMTDRMVCVMRRSHPLAETELTLEAFLTSRQLRVAMSPTDLRFVDDVLAREGHARDVALNLPHWLTVPHILRHSDLVSVMPERLARALASPDLVARILPFASAPFEWSLYWHRRHDGNPAIQWLRRRITEAAATSSEA